MTTKDEALKQALAALEFSKSYLDDLADVHGTSKKAKPGSTSWIVNRAILACREALAQKDEPIAGAKFYAAPPKLQPLTDAKLRAMWVNYAPIVGGVLEFARAIEAAHGIGVEHEPR